MRVNQRVFTERMDMLDGIRIPNCPSQFKVIAERIMDMATKPGYSIGDYHTMTELDKMLMIGYWREYDGLVTYVLDTHFDWWFIHKAADVAERAYEAGSKFSKAIKQ